MKKLIPLLLTVLVATTMFSSLVAASPIDDFFSWIRSLFGMPYSVAITGEACLVNSDCLTNLCNNPLSSLNTGSSTLITLGDSVSFTCPISAKQCVVSVTCRYSGYGSSFTNPVMSGQTVMAECKKPGGSTSGSFTVQYYGTCTGQGCPNGVVEGTEICDSNSRLQVITTTQNSCQGTIQQKSLCLSTCDGWGTWSDVPGSFVQTDKCCGVSCSPTTAQCNPSCSGTQYCVYSSSVASCTPTCSNGVCGSCSAACGTPSCSLTRGQCGVSCSSNSDCIVKTTTCPEKCDGRKYVGAVPSQSCNPTCVNGACTDCSSICPYVGGSYIVGKCGANCVADQACGQCGNNACVDGILQGCQPKQNVCGSGFVCQ